MITGKHLIAGNWVEGETKFDNSPSSGPTHSFSVGTPAHVEAAATAAEEAFKTFGYSTRAERAALLNKIADEIDARGEAITEIGVQESGLPEVRLNGERGRTVGQLRLFASHIEKGDYLDRRHDVALPDRAPLPRPDIKLMQRPLGPVAVFGASNFPLAFSTAGGDTASALAAGCPVIVKGHSAHPGTSEIVAQAIDAAIKATGVHPGVFSLIQGGKRDVGQALVQHPLVKAVGFTGSLGGGRALYDLAHARPEPIPFYGELGSVNPMFLLPAATESRGEEIGAAWGGSLTMGAGQFCTNPGVAIVLEGADADKFVEAATTSLSNVGEQTMLTDGIAEAYREGAKRIEESSGVRQILATSCDRREAAPYFFETTGDNWLANHALGEEVFGPLGIVVKVKDAAQMLEIAANLDGQLTCTMHLDDADADLANQLLPLIERKAGRILCNGFPTGVEVSEAMMHGGPFPASTDSRSTSVGTMAIRRFLRPVAYQNFPQNVLPADLQ